VVTVEFGVEFFSDLCTPFGWTASEWGWQCILGLSQWYALLEGFPDLEAYVDNFFLFSHPGLHHVHSERCKGIEKVFAALGIPLHERMIGSSFKGLGWMWDLSPTDGPPRMVCADDKFRYVCRKLADWASSPKLRIKPAEKLIGLLRWLSAGFPVGRTHLAYLVHDVAKFKRLARAKCLGPSHRYSLSARSREAIAFWHKAFPRWDKSLPVFLAFGPTASWELLGRFDASTEEFGCGGILWIPGAPELLAFSRKWSAEDKRFGFRQKVVSSGVMEALAALWWMRIFARYCDGKRVLLEGDSTCAVQAIRKAYSPSPPLMASVHRICQSEARHRIVLRTRAILGTFLPTLSLLLLPSLFIRLCYLRMLFDLTLPTHIFSHPTLIYCVGAA
jgi:hypothetical protein